MNKKEFYELCKTGTNLSLHISDDVGHGCISLMSDTPLIGRGREYVGGFVLYVSLWFDRHANARENYAKNVRKFKRWIVDYIDYKHNIKRVKR